MRGEQHDQSGLFISFDKDHQNRHISWQHDGVELPPETPKSPQPITSSRVRKGRATPIRSGKRGQVGAEDGRARFPGRRLEIASSNRPHSTSVTSHDKYDVPRTGAGESR